MHTLKCGDNAPGRSADPSASQGPWPASTAADAESAERAQRREETRKYVERVDRYLARDDALRPVYDSAVD